jgi:hypothetical protein
MADLTGSEKDAIVSQAVIAFGPGLRGWRFGRTDPALA